MPLRTWRRYNPDMQRLHRTLLLLIICWGLPAAQVLAQSDSAPPAVLASNVYQAGILVDGRVLYVTFDGACNTLDLGSGAIEPWILDWNPADLGWESAGGGGFNWKLAVSPNGRHVALAVTVGATHRDPAGDYMDTAVAVILSDHTGAKARCVALAELTDGGPPLDFTTDNRRLVGPWLFPCPPTAAAFQQYINQEHDAPEADAINYIDTRSRTGMLQDGLPDHEFYVKAEYSDFFVCESLDEPGLIFASFTHPGIAGRYNPPEAWAWNDYQWVLPEALLVSYGEASQTLVDVDGTRHAAPQPVWRCYTTLPDGTCLFSNDRGRSVKYGKVDWPTFTVDWWVERPDLAGFREPLNADGWPEQLHQWIPLRDASGVLIIDPAEGSLVLTRVSREGALP